MSGPKRKPDRYAKGRCNVNIAEAIHHLPEKFMELLLGNRSQQPSADGLLRSLTPEQRERLLSYDGPVASGDQSLPKLRR